MKKCFLILLLLASFTIQIAGSENLYRLSYAISGNAKGRILLIFPYRVYYSSSASLIFSTSLLADATEWFTLKEVDRTGYMIRTLGFSGRSLGILTADNAKSRGKKLSLGLLENFSAEAPEYSKYIKKSFWNNFTFKKIKGSIKFLRSNKGINTNLKYDLWMKRSPGESPLMINFNIYRILGEIIKSSDFSYLPPDKDIAGLISEGNMKWKSSQIDFSEMLAQSALYAAGIFRRIRRLKQEKPFIAEFSSEFLDNRHIIIRGFAEPEISVFRSFLIKKFIREVIIRIKDQKMISDRMTIEVYNSDGKGGRFSTSLKLIES